MYVCIYQGYYNENNVTVIRPARLIWYQYVHRKGKKRLDITKDHLKDTEEDNVSRGTRIITTLSDIQLLYHLNSLHQRCSNV